MVNQCTKYEVSRFTRYGRYEWRCKMQKIGWFGVVRGTQCHGQCHQRLTLETSNFVHGSTVWLVGVGWLE